MHFVIREIFTAVIVKYSKLKQIRVCVLFLLFLVFCCCFFCFVLFCMSVLFWLLYGLVVGHCKLVGERDTIQWCQIENRRYYLFICVWAYVRHFVLLPSYTKSVA